MAERPLPPGVKVCVRGCVADRHQKPDQSAEHGQRRRNGPRPPMPILTNYVRRGNARSPDRVWIVHRLDRETSGLMVFAKTEAAKLALQAQWRKAEKRYLAVVEGHPPADRGLLRSHLDESNPVKVYSAAPRADSPCGDQLPGDETKRDPRAGRLTLETGRAIRSACIWPMRKCPIIGDHKYGARTNPAGRLGLHANFSIPAPFSGEILGSNPLCPKPGAAGVR